MSNNCEKTTYETFGEAQKVINGFKKVGRSYGKNKRKFATKKPKRVYKCEICDKYHITSQNKAKVKRKVKYKTF